MCHALVPSLSKYSVSNSRYLFCSECELVVCSVPAVLWWVQKLSLICSVSLLVSGCKGEWCFLQLSLYIAGLFYTFKLYVLFLLLYFLAWYFSKMLISMVRVNIFIFFQLQGLNWSLLSIFLLAFCRFSLLDCRNPM